MIIIGEKINGTIPGVKKAIKNKDEEYIKDLALRQEKAGADFIDVCAGTEPKQEEETLLWLMDIVQDVVDIPLCIDSPNSKTIKKVFAKAEKPGIINSASREDNKYEDIYPLIKGTDWQVISLTCGDDIPQDVETRVQIAKFLIEEAEKYDIKHENIHIDPLVIALATDNQSFLKFIQTMEEVKKIYPDVKITSGLSNISFGMPLRKTINKTFLSIAMYTGMDSAILDPCDQSMMSTLLATEALLGQDPYCRNFTNAYREKKIGNRE